MSGTALSHTDMIALHHANTAPTWLVPLQPASVAKEAPQVAWLVKGLLPDAGLTVIFGASNSGKTFLALDLALALACAQGHWLEQRCHASGVIYLALEGNLAARLRAWEREHGTARQRDATFAVYSGALDLFSISTDGVTRIADDLLAQTIEMGWRPGLLIVDTLVRAAPGADENSVKDMSRVIENLTALGRALNACVLVIHHSGKNQDAGMRGSSALLGAADQVLEVRQEHNARTVKVFKSRDAGKDIDISFDLKVVELELDDDGEPITSCVVMAQAPDAERRYQPPPKPKGNNQRIVFQVLWDILLSLGQPGIAPAPDDRPSVSLDELIANTRALLPCEPRRAPERIRSAVTAMVASGVVHFENERLWLPSGTFTPQGQPRK
ncbi:AAA family ATPase [Alcaligenaceae bacterium]|nr:AAA family ATPase [Alcaligenaceae bacterium]